MAKPLATLLFEMGADVARLQKDMAAAKGIVDNSFASMKRAADTVKSAFAAIGVSLSVGAIINFGKSAINAADDMSKLGQKIGVTTEEVAGLQLAFRLAGAGGGVMETALAKLAKEAESGNKAFAQLGVQTKNTDGTMRSTSQILRDVADRFMVMDDGAQKTALAIQLFGRAGAQLIPLLNSGSQSLEEMDEMARKLGLTISTEAGKQAELFNDTLELLSLSMDGVARKAIMPLLPALNGIAQGMLTTTTESNALLTASDALNFVFKVLYSSVIVLFTPLQVLAALFIGVGTSIKSLLSGEFREAGRAFMDMTKTIEDISQNALTKHQMAWTNLGQATADSMQVSNMAMDRQRKKLAELNVSFEENEAVTKKAQAEYEKIAKSIDKATVAALAEIEAGGKLTDAKKLELDVRAKLDDTTVKLTASQRKEIEAKLAAAQAALSDRDAQKAADDARKALTQTLGKEIEEIEKQLAAQRKANEEAGLSREQIARLEIQRLRDAAAIAQRNAQLRIESGINDEITEQYQKQSEGLRQLADEKEKGIHVESAKQARNAWQEASEAIQKGLTDALMRAFESGKSFMDAFKETLRNAFKTLVLEPTIRGIFAPVSGAVGGLFSGVANAFTGGGGGGGGGGILGSIGSSIAGSGMLGSGLMYGLAGWGAGGSVLGALGGAGSMISGGIAAGSLGSIAAGIGGVLGALGPIALGIGLLIKGFSRGPKQTTGTGIEGGFLGGDFEGQQYADWMRKGGWFRSTKRGTDYNPLAQDLKAQFDEAGAALFAGATEYAKVLGLPIDALKDVNYRVKIALTEDEQANAAAIEKALEGYRNSLAGAFAEMLEPFQRSGEALADTLQRLAMLQAFSQDINQLGGIFSRVATLSVDAKEQLLEFSGGMEAFVRQAQGFVANYYSESERFGIAASRIREQLSALGITGDISTRAEFRKLIESTDISTEEGRRQLAALLALSEQFAQVGSYLEQQGITLDELAEAAPQVEILKSILDDAEIQTKAAQRTADATERLFDGVTDMGKLIAAAVAGSTEAIRRLQEIMESGQAAIVQATRENTRILDSWDNNGSIATTAGEP
jgi:hypothetical protein